MSATNDTVGALHDLSAAVLRELSRSGEYDAAAKRFREMSETCWEMHAATRTHDASIKATLAAFESANRVLDEATGKADEAAP